MAKEGGEDAGRICVPSPPQMRTNQASNNNISMFTRKWSSQNTSSSSSPAHKGREQWQIKDQWLLQPCTQRQRAMADQGPVAPPALHTKAESNGRSRTSGSSSLAHKGREQWQIKDQWLLQPYTQRQRAMADQGGSMRFQSFRKDNCRP